MCVDCALCLKSGERLVFSNLLLVIFLFEIPIAVTKNIAVYGGDVTLSTVVDLYQRFRGMCYLHLQVKQPF
jgi:hypothetical protein